MVVKRFEIGKYLGAYVGFSMKNFSLGFGLSRYGFNIDLAFVWIEVQW